MPDHPRIISNNDLVAVRSWELVTDSNGVQLFNASFELRPDRVLDAPTHLQLYSSIPHLFNLPLVPVPVPVPVAPSVLDAPATATVAVQMQNVPLEKPARVKQSATNGG